MEHQFQPKGVCTKNIAFTLEEGILTQLSVEGGCEGNRKGICALAVGLPAQEIIDRLSGIRCRHLPSSCPDQLAQALKLALLKEV